MPFQKSNGYMSELDQWSEKTVLDPLGDAWRAVLGAPDEETEAECKRHLNQVEAEVQKAIREKVLDSYRNGQKSGPYKPKPAGK